MSAVSKMQNNDAYGLIPLIARWDEDFLIDGVNGRIFTYGQFFGAALAASKALETRGLSRGDTLVVVTPNCAEALALFMGALFAGIRIALIDPQKGTQDIEDTLAQVHYKVLLSDKELDAVYTGLFAKEYTAEELEAAVQDVDFDAVFLITFTSGSTGKPKGVMHSFANLALSAQAFAQQFGFGPAHTFYHVLPMTYMAGVLNSFVLPLLSGSKLVVGPRFSVMHAGNFWEIPKKYGVNAFWLVPTLLSVVLKLDRQENSTYPHASIGCVGTAPLSQELQQSFESKFGIPLYESYGLSETLLNATQVPGRKGGGGSVGIVLPGTQVTFADDGEMMIATDWMYKAYLIEGEEVSFMGKEFPSGDLGALDQQGCLTITGRKKDIIIRGGINISPRQLEDFLSAQKVFEEAVVMGFPNEVLGEKTVCFFVPLSAGFSDDNKKTLLEKIADRLGKN